MNPSDSDQQGGPGEGAGHFKSTIRNWRYLLILIGLIVLVLAFYGEENWRGYHAWQSYRQQRAARGQLTEPESYIPPPVPDDENFAMSPALAPLFEFIPGTQQWRDTNAPHVFEPFMSRFDGAAKTIKQPPGVRKNSWVHRSVDLDGWARAFEEGPATGHRQRTVAVEHPRTNEEAAAAVLRALADFSPVLDELRSASQKPYSRFSLAYQEANPSTILLPHLSRLKQFCQVVQLHACAELASGGIEEAKADVLLMLALVNATRTEPILISQLVRLSEIQLALQPLGEGMGKWTEPQLRTLQEHLQGLDFLQDMTRALEAERTLFGGGVIEYVRRSPKKLEVTQMFRDDPAITGAGLLVAAAPNGWFYLEELNYNVLCDRYLLPAIDLTNRLVRPAEVRRLGDAIAEATSGSPASRLLKHRVFAGLLLPALSKVSHKAAFGQTAVDEAVIACALERYRLSRSKLPDSLEELIPDYLSRLRVDVINGRPLSYKKTSDTDYTIYSVGWNEADDGGVVKQNKSGGVDQDQGDWVWSNVF